jgi:Phosphoadenosine phosphosulfate reductase family
MKIVVGFSGGVTSAYCAGWALAKFPKNDVVLLFHDTKEEHPDTYRFIREMAEVLDHPVTERSDGRSVVQVCEDEHALANNRMAFCSKILKANQRDKFFKECRANGETDLVNVLGFTAIEWRRIQRNTMRGECEGYKVRFPLVEDGISKQQAADWCLAKGVRPTEMYRWSEHANCIGCARGGKAYWLAVAKEEPEIFEQRARLEEQFGHTFLKDTTLRNLVQIGLRHKVQPRESIEIGSCDCGD